MRCWKNIFTFLTLILFLTVIAISQLPDERLHLIACDVGQGDATLVVYKNIQILTDGGPDGKVLNCLGRHIPFWDKEIELVILTHPDKDHFGGLTDVFRRYKVINYLYNPVTISKPEYQVLEKEVGGHGTNSMYPHTGQVIRVGMIHLDVLAPFEQTTPDNNDPQTTRKIREDKTNDYSIVSLISFGKFDALLTGDMPPDVSDKLAATWTSEPVDYIKIPHHGSKNGLTDNLLKAVMPKLAVISVGKNTYGHPAKDVLEMLEKNGIKYLRTDKEGDIEVITDGEKYWISN